MEVVLAYDEVGGENLITDMESAAVADSGPAGGHQTA